jgi:microcystin-dependent protein
VSTPYLGEIRLMSFSFAPRAWALCNGQVLPINQNQALFSLLGTQYGGNGQTTFSLPDMRGRMPIHMGGAYVIGQNGGEANHALSTAEIPTHTHAMPATAAVATAGVGPDAGRPAVAAHAPYRSGTLTPVVQARQTSLAGGNQPHNNMQPYLALNFCIALQGIFPSRN